VKRYDRIILVALVLVFGAGFIVTARGALSSYVTWAEAGTTGRWVQIKGTVVLGSLHTGDDGSFSFAMKDRLGAVSLVTHTGQVPVNLLEADQVVVAGRYHPGVFRARRILVRCPTKFQTTR